MAKKGHANMLARGVVKGLIKREDNLRFAFPISLHLVQIRN